MKCPNCQTENLATSKTCSKCGAQLSAESVESAPISPTQDPENTSQPPQSSSEPSNATQTPQIPSTPTTATETPKPESKDEPTFLTTDQLDSVQPAPKITPNTPTTPAPTLTATTIQATPVSSPKPTTAQTADAPTLTPNAIPAQPEATEKTESPNYLKNILFAIIAPISLIKEELPKYTKIGRAAIMSGISILLVTASLYISTIISLVRVKNYFSGEITWEWSNLGNTDVFKYLWPYILLITFLLAVLTTSFFTVGLIFKKKVPFSKVLAIFSFSIIPLSVAMILSPFLSMIHSYVSIGFNLAAEISAICIIFEGLSQEYDFKNDNKIYHAIASVIMAFIIILIIAKIINELNINLPISPYLSLLLF